MTLLFLFPSVVVDLHPSRLVIKLDQGRDQGDEDNYKNTEKEIDDPNRENHRKNFSGGSKFPLWYRYFGSYEIEYSDGSIRLALWFMKLS